MTEKLFAVMVGGSHPGSNIELHDIRFVVGETLEATYKELKASWWGIPATLHIDAWCELSALDGFRVEVRDTPKKSKAERHDNQLYFINVGYYEPGLFGEGHAYRFMIGPDRPSVWGRALREVSSSLQNRHKDNFMAVDEVIDIRRDLFAQDRYVHLTPDPALATARPKFNSEYIPFLKQKKQD